MAAGTQAHFPCACTMVRRPATWAPREGGVGFMGKIITNRLTIVKGNFIGCGKFFVSGEGGRVFSFSFFPPLTKPHGGPFVRLL